MKLDKLKQLENEIKKQPFSKLLDKFGTKMREQLNPNPQPKEQKSVKQKILEGTA